LFLSKLFKFGCLLYIPPFTAALITKCEAAAPWSVPRLPFSFTLLPNSLYVTIKTSLNKSLFLSSFTKYFNDVFKSLCNSFCLFIWFECVSYPPWDSLITGICKFESIIFSASFKSFWSSISNVLLSFLIYFLNALFAFTTILFCFWIKSKTLFVFLSEKLFDCFINWLISFICKIFNCCENINVFCCLPITTPCDGLFSSKL